MNCNLHIQELCGLHVVRMKERIFRACKCKSVHHYECIHMSINHSVPNLTGDGQPIKKLKQIIVITCFHFFAQKV